MCEADVDFVLPGTGTGTPPVPWCVGKGPGGEEEIRGEGTPKGGDEGGKEGHTREVSTMNKPPKNGLLVRHFVVIRGS